MLAGCATSRWNQPDVAADAAPPNTVAGDTSRPLYDSRGEPVASGETWDDGDKETWWQRTLDSVPTASEMTMNLRRMIGLGPDEAIAKKAFAEGERLFGAGQFLAASKQYKKAAFRWPDSPLEEDALFMLAESRFFADRYGSADDAYGNLFEKYDNTRHLERAVSRQFAIAQYWEQKHAQRPIWPIVPRVWDRTQPWFDTLGNARKAYESVHLHDPTGPLADDSVMSLANSYFVREQFDDADEYYTILRTDYPKSPFQLQAHLLGLQAKLGRYQGPEYGGEPLEEAEDLSDQILTQFGTQLADDRERVLNSRAGIKEALAKRDYEMAQYYERTGYHRAARFYYGVVVEDHPLSQVADLSRNRLSELEGVPDQTTILDRVNKVVSIAGDRVRLASATRPVEPKTATEPTDAVQR